MIHPKSKIIIQQQQPLLKSSLHLTEVLKQDILTFFYLCLDFNKKTFQYTLDLYKKL